MQVLHHAHAGLVEVTLLRLGELLGGDFAVAELDGVVAFLVRRLLLDDDAGTGLYYGDRNDLARLIEDLRHADLLADDGFLHCISSYWLLVVSHGPGLGSRPEADDLTRPHTQAADYGSFTCVGLPGLGYAGIRA